MRPLSNLTVLDLTVNTPGPFCSMILSDLGARVIKIEPPGGDPLRASSEKMFASLNRGKESFLCDLKSDADRQTFLQLVDKADIVLEGSRPGVANRLGVDYETLSTQNPKLVYCSISGFGQEGPWRDRPGHDVNYLALSGYLGLQTVVEGRPWPPAILISDVASGLYASIAVLAAVAGRAASGEGSYIDLSMTESALSLLGLEIDGESSDSGDAPPPNVTFIPTYGLFACADERWLSLGIVHEDHFWQRLCDLADLGELASLTFEQRVEQAEFVKRRLEATFAKGTSSEWERKLIEADVPAAVVNDIHELFDLPQFVARRSFVDIGLHRFVAQPMTFSSGSVRPTKAPPTLNEHRDAILAELGYTA
jgi:crotonobetainyl-CoA:carnitine CoA-transferase CaiB-like acyl-CoA transferase